MRAFGVIVGILLAIMALTWVLNAMDYVSFAFWGKKNEDLKTKVYKSTVSYTEGHLHDLANHQEEYYATKDTDDRKAIKAWVKQTFPADFKTEDCPDDLRGFLIMCRGY